MAIKNPVAGVQNADIMNAVRSVASNTYQDRVPIVTQDNLRATGNAILDYQPIYNEFSASLVDKFAFQYVHRQMIRNPLAMFKRPPIRLGRSIEEIFVDAAQDQGFSPELAESRVFKRVIPDISSIYHTINREAQYKASITRVQLERAFFEEYGLSTLIGGIIQSLYNGDNNDEYLIMKNLVGTAYTSGLMFPVTVSAVSSQQTATALVKAIRQHVESFRLPNRKYNSMGVLRQVDPEDLVLFITPALAAEVDVEVQAAAFNLDKTEFLARRIIVEDFGPAPIQAVLADREFIMQWDSYYGTDSIWNPEGLTTNITLTHMGIYSTSRFANCVAFTTATSDVTSVTVTGADTVATGTNALYTATVASTAGNYQPNAVTWSISGEKSSATYITPAGRLFVSSEETADTLTVKATSLYDSTVSGTLSVTIS